MSQRIIYHGRCAQLCLACTAGCNDSNGRRCRRTQPTGVTHLSSCCKTLQASGYGTASQQRCPGQHAQSARFVAPRVFSVFSGAACPAHNSRFSVRLRTARLFARHCQHSIANLAHRRLFNTQCCLRVPVAKPRTLPYVTHCQLGVADRCWRLPVRCWRRRLSSVEEAASKELGRR